MPSGPPGRGGWQPLGKASMDCKWQSVHREVTTPQHAAESSKRELHPCSHQGAHRTLCLKARSSRGARSMAVCSGAQGQHLGFYQGNGFSSGILPCTAQRTCVKRTTCKFRKWIRMLQPPAATFAGGLLPITLILLRVSELVY